MHWLEGGVVRIPLRHIYLWLIVLAMAYLLARELSLTQKRRRQLNCEGFQQDLLRRAAREEAWRRQNWKSKTTKTKTADTHEEEDQNEKIADKMSEENVTASNEKAADNVAVGACRMEPEPTTPWVCQHCFRPRARTISKRLQVVTYSPSKFPRGPAYLFHLRNSKQQSYVNDFLVQPWDVCRPDRNCPYLLAVQLSMAEDVERRHAVRTTWGSVAKTQVWPHAHVNGQVQILFVLAHPDSDKRLENARFKEIQREARIHGDILCIKMADSYHLLTLKLMSAFKWVKEHCHSVKFVLKVDTDTFVNIPLLLDVLLFNEERLKFSVLGTIYKDERVVHRVGRWAVNESVYPLPTYPVYASGCSYTVSISALAQIVDLSPYMIQDHASTFLGPDFYTTGLLGQFLALEFFRVPDTDIFGQCNATTWSTCTMIEDNKVLGVVPYTPGDTTHLLRLWRSFYRYYGHYRA